MEIERKYLIQVADIPFNPKDFPCRKIKQGYLNRNPVVRVRQDNDEYYLTYKGSGLMAREEFNLPLNRESFNHLLKKCDGKILMKDRYVIPLDKVLAIEMDFFQGDYKGLVMAEVEFPDEKMANSFTPPSWFGQDVTFDPAYHNSNMI